MNLNRYGLLIAAIAGLILGCGGANQAADKPAAGAAPIQTEAATLTVSEPTGEIDEMLAEKGEELFQSKGCIACHTFGKGRLAGPDLAGVTERRTFEWIYHQLVVPDSMTIHDPAAQQLMAEYMTQMPNLGLQPEDAKALYEYLREQDVEVKEEEEEAE